MSVPTTDNLDSDILCSVIEHVFMPPKLPRVCPDEDTERKTNVALCNSLIESAEEFLKILPSSESSLWMHMIKMMELIRHAAEAPFTEDDLHRTLSDMVPGDVFCVHIRAQNAALIVRRLATADFIQFEVFEVLPLIRAVTEAEGKLLCSYPGPAIHIPVDVFTDECFLRELSSFLVQMDVDRLDSAPTTNSVDCNIYDGANPRYISELLVGILRGYGQPAAVNRITKRIGDEVLSDTDNVKPWRRSPIWLILRISLHSSLHVNNLYKNFILFFHAHLLRTCVRRVFPSELLYTMRVKMARRLSKLGPAHRHDVSQFVHDTARDTDVILSNRWIAFQDNGPISPALQLKGHDFVADSQISLDNSYKYLRKMLRLAAPDLKQNRFSPSRESRLQNVHDFIQFANGQLEKAIAKDPEIAIADFELSVERNLEPWLAASSNNDNSSDVIASCIEQYFAGTKDLYGKNPEDTSIMILTVMDLWVALDKLAIQQCPLLKEYSPEIPSSFLHSLLLHRSPDLKRALHIEEHLYWRHKEALEVPSVFENSIGAYSFAVRCFRTSEHLRRLYHEINTHALHERAAKRVELASLKQRANSLLDEASDMRHRWITDDLGRRAHSSVCQKCTLVNRANALEIRVHEWPLPPSKMHTQLAVFELSPPRAFSAWRDVTYTILCDIGLPSFAHSRIQPAVLLDLSSGLQRWTTKRRQGHRVTLASITPEFSDRMVNIAEEESSIFMESQLSFRLFDYIHRSWVAVSFSNSSPREFFVPPILQSSPYNYLHRFVTGIQHMPNDIITAQAHCPEEINLHEFIAFSGLRSGPRLQWLNIGRELASPSLSFDREDVHTLISQAAWQLGPLSNGVREWHTDLGISSFGNALLCEMECLLEKIKGNWLEEVTVRTIALICSRLLASTMDPNISLRACALLREARNVTYRWIYEVRMKLDSTTKDDTSCGDLRHRLCMLSATCFSTFDVCPEHVPDMLSNKEDFSIALQCAVIVHDNTPSSLSDGNSLFFTRMLSRHRRLLHRLEPMFSQRLPSFRSRAILLHSDAYNEALIRLRPGYYPDSRWHVLPKPNSQWISCITREKQHVYYDLLTGELIVGAKPLGRLPQEIVEHPTYFSVFGARILDASPADVHGMVYIAQSVEFGYQILFSWNNGDLILQAKDPVNSQIFQVIPRPVLLGDFPRHLVDGYIHWLNLSTGELEFRPARSPWVPESSNWRLYIRRPGSLKGLNKFGLRCVALLQKPSKDDSPVQLIDIRSNTFSVVSSLLSPLESPEHIVVTRTAQSLEVSLPRLRLSFFVNVDWELECRSMPGYVVDSTQSCGTMFGLRNKLVLRGGPSGHEESLLPRRVIIPQGKIFFRTKGDFANVSMNIDAEQYVRWHEYTVDTNLGCLTSNSSLGSKLYQCYLHALTSHCLPDPLLGHTGTEEALYILRNAACRSFQRLDVHEQNLLKLISNLSPVRAFSEWPTTKVQWSDLPALSQHHDFFHTVCSILDHARALEVFYDEHIVRNTRDHDQTLLNRAAFRNKSYYPSDLHSPGQSSYSGDVEYRPREVFDDGTADHVAFRTSWSIWNMRPSVDKELWNVMNSWGSVGSTRQPTNEISLRYSRYWLEFNAARDWFRIYNLCRQAAINQKIRNLRIELSFSLPAAAYSSSISNSNIVHFIMIFALDNRFRHINPPPDGLYVLSDGLAPKVTKLNDIISQSATRMSLNSEHDSKVRRIKYSERLILGADPVVQKGNVATISNESSAVAKSLLRSWPDYESVDFLQRDRSVCIPRIKEYFESISRNIQLGNHVLELQSILQHYQNVSIPALMPYVFQPQSTTSRSISTSYSLHHVLASRVNVPTPSAHGEPIQVGIIPPTTASEGVTLRASSDGLETLIEELRHSPNALLRFYGIELSKSHQELLGQSVSQSAWGAVPSHELLLLYHKECSRRKKKLFSHILVALSPSQIVEETNRIAGLWPRITPRSILRQLAHDRIATLPDHWRFVIMHYAVSFLQYQQSLRLLELSSRQEHEELVREIEAIHHDILAESTPDWLLIQIEANLVARPVQVAVARKMISPNSNRNVSLQLNMGEGKSSVIVPLVVSALINGSNLVRVVTLKPLSNQMFQLLVSQLSGLANRPIFYVPISRSLRVNPTLVNTIRGLFERCVSEGGVLVVQPEHVLSLKLMYIDILLSSRRGIDPITDDPSGLSHVLNSHAQPDVSHPEFEGTFPTRRKSRVNKEDSMVHQLRALQEWLATISRDVLDESDEILHARYQLIYSSGEQKPVDDHPHRWTTIQQVLSRLQAHAAKLCAAFPEMLVIDTASRGFPIIRILDPAIIHHISSLVIDDALQGRLPNLPVGVIPSPVQAAARRFISQKEVSDVDHALIHSHCTGTTFFNGILLLRGLLMDGDGILGYVLKEQRWRVDYGLDPGRTLLAVPYRAKDVPSPRAEFAHPDVGITLTCLSYYYGGLTKDQLLVCFGLLGNLDNPKMEYDYWVGLRQDLPAELRRLNGVNMEDETQVNDFIVPLFSRNKRIVDFYLSQVVFPQAAREFPAKLPTSSWDLVEHKANLTTGFSGTNDNCHLLPTSITQEDPIFVLGTNALVLRHLLRPENDHYECVEGDNGGRVSAVAFLKYLVKQEPEIRVLLDVGAQLLELQNKELVRYWLFLRPDVSAAIFFNHSDHLTVMTPDGTIEPFISSPFNRQLDKCVVYLDDAHTRGTDLKLPRGMRAAVTLGPRVTKDRLVQGCMRMRQLGKGHSVMFLAPKEVDHRIRSLIQNEMTSGGHIRALDILRWAMHETCEDICRYLPYWAQQGLDHYKRFAAYEEYRSSGDLVVLQSAWLQPDSQTLEEMYWIAQVANCKMCSEIRSIPSLNERMERLGVTRLINTRISEEQEREVNHEIEPDHHTGIVVERSRPPKVQPAQHIIHADILEFIETGKVPESSMHISPLLGPLNMVRSLDSMTEWSPSPLATADFIATTLNSDGGRLTEYLRPVNWILSSGSGKKSVVIVISPYEANELLPIIRTSNKVRLHIYAPRVTSSMRSFSDLTFYSIPDSQTKQWSAPTHIRIELNLFAGQLYFDSIEEYEGVCALLALWMAHPKTEYSEVDGFVPPAYRTGRSSPFARSRIPILKKLVELRRKGMSYHLTHLGQVLNAKPLSEETLWELRG